MNPSLGLDANGGMPGDAVLSEAEQHEKKRLLALSEDAILSLSPKSVRKLGRYRHQVRNAHRNIRLSQTQAPERSNLPLPQMPHQLPHQLPFQSLRVSTNPDSAPLVPPPAGTAASASTTFSSSSLLTDWQPRKHRISSPNNPGGSKSSKRSRPVPFVEDSDFSEEDSAHRPSTLRDEIARQQKALQESRNPSTKRKHELSDRDDATRKKDRKKLKAAQSSSFSAQAPIQHELAASPMVDASTPGLPSSRTSSESDHNKGRRDLHTQNNSSVQSPTDSESSGALRQETQPRGSKGKRPDFRPDDFEQEFVDAAEELDARSQQIELDRQFVAEQQQSLDRETAAELTRQSNAFASAVNRNHSAVGRESPGNGEGPSTGASAPVPSSLRKSSIILGDVMDPPREPDWYVQTKVPNSRGPRTGATNYPSTIDLKFNELRTAITKCEAAASHGRCSLKDFDKVNDCIHKAMFIEFVDDRAAKAAIRKNRLLHNDDGLPRLFRPEWLARHDISYPFYIVADAKELYTKWWMGIFDTSLYRGIFIGKKKNEKVDRAGSANRLDPRYPGRAEGKFFGNGRLLNGQWWPNQLCALRDGAHNSSQGGIAGHAEEGAWSIILCGDTKYPDVDNGNDIQYCGTEGISGQMSPHTNYMKKSLETGNPVRVLRSENCKNPLYRPAKGYRYDGLYKVVGQELIQPAKELWRFGMVRLPGQDPIRHQGPEVRPTPEELEKFAKSKEERAYLA